MNSANPGEAGPPREASEPRLPPLPPPNSGGSVCAAAAAAAPPSAAATAAKTGENWRFISGEETCEWPGARKGGGGAKAAAKGCGGAVAARRDGEEEGEAPRSNVPSLLLFSQAAPPNSPLPMTMPLPPLLWKTERGEKEGKEGSWSLSLSIFVFFPWGTARSESIFYARISLLPSLSDFLRFLVGTNHKNVRDGLAPGKERERENRLGEGDESSDNPSLSRRRESTKSKRSAAERHRKFHSSLFRPGGDTLSRSTR